MLFFTSDTMKHRRLLLSSAILVVAVLAGARVTAQSRQAEKEAAVSAHMEAARSAAGKEHTGLFEALCSQFAEPNGRPPVLRQRGPGGAPFDRSTLHAEPVKVFDNHYFVGDKDYDTWAVTTSEGIIILGALFSYSAEDGIVNGLKKLGLNPATIRYVIASHADRDYVGGAGHLQKQYGARIVMGAEDWSLLERANVNWARRDIAATDGQKLTLGDTTITLYLTPGHTLGTLSLLVPVKDNGRRHLAASWGGTVFNWLSNSPAYIGPDRPNKFWFDSYIKSAVRFRENAAKAGADVLIADHNRFGGSKSKLAAMGSRRLHDPHPFVIGNEAVVRSITVHSECAQAGLARE